jgi:excisionase family DNA binding protein
MSSALEWVHTDLRRGFSAKLFREDPQHDRFATALKRPQSCGRLNLAGQNAENHEQNPEKGAAAMAQIQHPRDESQLVFTSSQAARYLGVSLATVRRWTDAGFLTGYRTPGGQRRFSREQLDGFIASLQRTDQGRAKPAQTSGEATPSIRHVA